MIGTITSKGQTTIPKEVRERLGLETGARIEWVVEEGKATVRPRKLRAVDLAGILGPPPSGGPMTVQDMDQAIMESIATDDERIVREWREGSK